MKSFFSSNRKNNFPFLMLSSNIFRSFAYVTLTNLKNQIMDKFVCTVCGYVYDPEVGDPDNGIEPGTPFEALPEDWVCPLCGVGKEDFEKEA